MRTLLTIGFVLFGGLAVAIGNRPQVALNLIPANGSTPTASPKDLLPAPGGTLTCNGVSDFGDKKDIHIVNVGTESRGRYIIKEFRDDVKMSVVSSSDSQVELKGSKWQDITLSLDASVTLNADGTGTAWFGAGGWNPEKEHYSLSGCALTSEAVPQ